MAVPNQPLLAYPSFISSTVGYTYTHPTSSKQWPLVVPVFCPQATGPSRSWPLSQCQFSWRWFCHTANMPDMCRQQFLLLGWGLRNGTHNLKKTSEVMVRLRSWLYYYPYCDVAFPPFKQQQLALTVHVPTKGKYCWRKYGKIIHLRGRRSGARSGCCSYVPLTHPVPPLWKADRNQNPRDEGSKNLFFLLR